jgi:hypothetical protein
MYDKRDYRRAGRKAFFVENYSLGRCRCMTAYVVGDEGEIRTDPDMTGQVVGDVGEIRTKSREAGIIDAEGRP